MGQSTSRIGTPCTSFDDAGLEESVRVCVASAVALERFDEYDGWGDRWPDSVVAKGAYECEGSGRPFGEAADPEVRLLFVVAQDLGGGALSGFDRAVEVALEVDGGVFAGEVAAAAALAFDPGEGLVLADLPI